VIKKYGDKISYWVSEKDNGIYHAMNKGIEVAKGDYYLFLNSGDTLADSNVLQTVDNRKLSKDIVYGNMQTVNNYGNITHLKMPHKIGIMHLYADTLWHPVSFIKHSVFEQYGNYSEQFKIVSDYEFFVRVILSKKVSVQYIPVEIARFDISGISSDMENRSQLIKERRMIQEIYFNPFLLFLFKIYSKLRNIK
jgi:glycosyltransferase involved in cell wall biosynthesis